MVRSKSGFTLIEIVISLGIILLLTGISVGYYGSFTNQRQLETESRNLANTLDQARKRALAGDQSTVCTTGNFTGGYKVVINPADYQLKVSCTITDGVLKDTKFASAVYADKSITVEFMPKGAGATTTESCIRLQKTGVDKCRCIELLQSGAIREGFCNSCESLIPCI